MDGRRALEQQRRAVVQRTQVSLACYLGFLVTSTICALRSLQLTHPVTLAALALVMGALFFLPRSYVPSAPAGSRPSPEEELQLGELRRLQRTGLLIRVAYLVGAFATAAVLPWLVRQT